MTAEQIVEASLDGMRQAETLRGAGLEVSRSDGDLFETSGAYAPLPLRELPVKQGWRTRFPHPWA